MNQWFGLGIALELKDSFSQGIATAQNTFERFRNSTQRGVQDIKTQIDALNSLQLGGAFLSENGEMIKGLGTSLLNPVVDLGKKVVTTSSQFEQWRMTLKALYKDADVANEKLAWGLKLAASTPFDMADVTQALIGFKAVGAESDTVFKNANGEARTFLEYMGDLAALRPDVGLDGVLMGVRNLLGGDGGRSLTMRMDIDLENILGREFGDTTDQIMQDLVEASDKLAGGLMKELEGTWGHLTGNLQDQAERLFLAIGDNGAFDMFKDALRGFSTIIDDIDDEKMAKIGTNIAKAFKLIWSPLNLVIKGLQTVFKWIIKLAESNSVFSSLVLGVTTFVGSILALTGVMLTFGGGLIQTISSLGLFLLMLQNSPNKFTGILNAFKTLASRILPMIALMGALALAWRTDFMGVKTTMTNFTNTLKTSWSEAKRISSLGVTDMLAELSKLDTTTFGGWLTYNLVRLMVLWEALCECWNTNELSDETFQKVQALGLLPLLSTILDIKQRATSFFKGFKEGWENVSNVVSKVVNFIGEKLGELIAWLFPVKDEVDKVSDSVGGIDIAKWEKFGEVTAYIVSMISGLSALSKIVKLFTKVTKSVTKVVKSITKITKGLTKVLKSANKVAKGIGNVVTWVGKFFGVIGGLVTQILGAFGIVVTLPAWVVGAITLAIMAIVALVVANWDEIKEYTIKTWNKIKDKTSEIWGKIKDWFNTNIQPWIDKIGELFTKCKDKIKEVLGNLKEWFVTKWSEIKDWYDTNIAPWVEIIAKLFEIAFALVRACILMLRDWFIEKWGEIKQWYTDNIEPWIEIIKEGWNNLKTKIGEILGGVKDWFVEKWGEIKSWYNENIQPWVDIIKTKWENFKGDLGEIFNTLKTNFSEAWGGIKDWYNTNISPWVEKIQGVWEGFKTAVGGVWDSISTAWHTTIDNLYTWVVGKVNDLIDLVNKVPFVEIEKIEAKTGSKAPLARPNGGFAYDMVGLNTGGYVKTEGVAMLHPNEVVVNDDLTQRLRTFLTENENNMTQPSGRSVQRMITPVINLEQPTPDVTVNIPTLDLESKIIPIETLRARREALQINNVEDIISTSNYDQSRSFVNNYDNTRSLVNNVDTHNILNKNLTNNVYEDVVRNIATNINNSANYDHSKQFTNDYAINQSKVNNFDTDNILNRNLTNNFYEEMIRNLQTNVNNSNYDSRNFTNNYADTKSLVNNLATDNILNRILTQNDYASNVRNLNNTISNSATYDSNDFTKYANMESLVNNLDTDNIFNRILTSAYYSTIKNLQSNITNSANYDQSKGLVNNYDTNRSLVNNVDTNTILNRHLTKNIYDDNVRNLYNNVNMDNNKSVATSLSTIMNNYDGDLGETISTNKNEYNTNSNVGDTLYNSLKNMATNTTNNTNNSTTNGNVDNSVTFSEGAIQIQLQQGTEADATKLAKIIMEKLKKEMQLRNTLNYRAN